MLALRADAQPPPDTSSRVAGADTLRVSLGACVERAIAVGEEMRLAEADLASARGAYQQARSDVFPHLTLSGGYTRQIESVFRGDGGDFQVQPFEPDTLAPLEDRVRDLENALPTASLATLGSLFESFANENIWTGSAGVTQKVFEGGGILAAVRVAKHALGSFESRLADREAEVRMLVREAYVAALLGDRSEEIAKLGLEQAETQLQRVRARHAVGDAAEFDLLQAEVQRDNLIPTLTAARNSRAIAYLQLAGIANLPVGVPIVLTTPLLDRAELPPDPFAVLDTVGVVAAALDNAMITALQQELEARRQAVTVAGSDAWPALSLFANYSKQAYPSDVWPERGDWRTDANAGVLLSWDVFDGLRTRGAVNQSAAEVMRTQQILEQEREWVQLAVAREIGELDRAAEELRSRTRTVQVARRAFELATLRYEEGASSLLEVEDARVAQQVAQLSEARARHDYYVALARLERYSDRPLFTRLVEQMGGESE